MFISIFVHIILGNSYSTYNIILIMTGEEYFRLKIGDTITVETPLAGYTKGQVFKVEFINSIGTIVYIRDVTLPLGAQIKVLPLTFLLDNFVVGGELPKKNDKTIELPFALHDKVWFLYNNEVCNGEIINCNAHIYYDGINITYKLSYISKYGKSAVTIASNKLFNAKEELLKSL